MSRTGSISSSNRENSELEAISDQVQSDYLTNSISIDNLATSLNSIVAQVQKIGKTLEIFSLYLRNNAIEREFKIPPYLRSNLPDNYLLTGVEGIDYSSLSIGGVDGGIVVGSLAGLDILGIRAVGSLIQYGKNKIDRVYYYPNKRPAIKLIPSFLNISKIGLDQYASLHRSILELDTAYHFLQSSPVTVDYLLMDGTFQYKRNPMITNARLRGLENKYFLILDELFNLAKETGTDIAWIVKDSRSTLFLEALGQLLPHIISEIPELYSTDYRQITATTRDVSFMYYFLQPGSRSFIMNRTFNDEMNKEISQNAFSFYLSAVPYDTPLRIDFTTPPNFSAQEVVQIAHRYASLILPLSQFNLFYSLPAPIVEADARARINQQEFAILLGALRKRTLGNSVETMQLRRSRSPFKF